MVDILKTIKDELPKVISDAITKAKIAPNKWKPSSIRIKVKTNFIPFSIICSIKVEYFIFWKACKEVINNILNVLTGIKNAVNLNNNINSGLWNILIAIYSEDIIRIIANINDIGVEKYKAESIVPLILLLSFFPL